MAVGYKNFEEFVKREYISADLGAKIYKIPSWRGGKDAWCDETKKIVCGLLEEGIPQNMIGRLLEVPIRTIYNWKKDISKEEQIKRKKEIIGKWYNDLTEEDIRKKGLANLEDYVDTYEETNRKFAEITDMLFMLKQEKFIFPYLPTHKDAYLFGANYGNGSLNSNYTLQFTGDEHDLDVIRSLLPLENNCKDERTALFSPAVGRLYYLLGLPKGERKEQEHYIPEWIKGGLFTREFLAGLFDTVLDYSEKKKGIRLRMYVLPEIKKSFEDFIKKVADMIDDTGIELTKKGARFKELKREYKQYEGMITFKFGKNNIRKIGEILPLKFKRSREIFKFS